MAPLCMALGKRGVGTFYIINLGMGFLLEIWRRWRSPVIDESTQVVFEYVDCAHAGKSGWGVLGRAKVRLFWAISNERRSCLRGEEGADSRRIQYTCSFPPDVM